MDDKEKRLRREWRQQPISQLRDMLRSSMKYTEQRMGQLEQLQADINRNKVYVELLTRYIQERTGNE